MPDTPIPVSKPTAKPTTPAPLRLPGTDLWRGFHDEIDRMFDRFSQGFGLPSLRRAFDMPAFDTSLTLAAPAIDVSEDDKAYRITAELPGMSDKDIDVTVTEDTITIKGEKREEKELKDKDYYFTERRYGSFQRSFVLPSGVDRDKIAASLDKGILSLTLPKTADAVKQQKKIDIKAS
jgi:HSP20 family protein